MEFSGELKTYIAMYWISHRCVVGVNILKREEKMSKTISPSTTARQRAASRCRKFKPNTIQKFYWEVNNHPLSVLDIVAHYLNQKNFWEDDVL